MEYESRVIDNFKDYLIYSNGTVYGKKHKKFVKQYPSDTGYVSKITEKMICLNILKHMS